MSTESSTETPLMTNSTNVLDSKSMLIGQPTPSSIVMTDKELPTISAGDLTISDQLSREGTLTLHHATYQQKPVIVQRVTPLLLHEQYDTLSVFAHRWSPFWLLITGVYVGSDTCAVVIGALPDIRFDSWLNADASKNWVNRCRLLRDVAVGLYQQRHVAGATHIAWNVSQLYLDKDGRVQVVPLLSETPISEAEEVCAIGKLIWQAASRKLELTEGWQQGKGLPRDCPPAVIALIQACTDPVTTARPSLKALAKGLDAFWQRALLGFSDALPRLPGTMSPTEKEQKYNLPAPQPFSRLAQEIGGLYTAFQPASTPSTTTTSVSQSLTDSVLASGSLNLLLIDDQRVSWLSADDPRYQTGVKVCALRDSTTPPAESKASQPKLQAEIERTLIDPNSSVDTLLWVGEADEDPSHCLQKTAWDLWQAPDWQAYRPGDLPPAAWLPLCVTLQQPDVTLFTRAHAVEESETLTENQWQIVQQAYCPFWLVQGMNHLDPLPNLYDANELHRGHTRLLLHSTPTQVFKLEESTNLMPHSADGRLLPSRYARYTTQDLSAWEGRYSGVIGPQAQTTAISNTAPLPLTLTAEKDLALHRDQLILPLDGDSQSTLGKGAFGEVLRGTYYGHPVAVKRFKEAKLSPIDSAQLKDEAAVMANLQSPFLIGMLGLSLDTPPLLVMELAQGGSLYHLLKDSSQPLSWPQRLRILRDIALGLNTLHAHELVHRDLKSLNILLDADGRAKLCDFGLSTLKSQAKDTSEVGTRLWNAPEVLSGKAATAASDRYSFGMICWEVVARRVPYQTLSWKNKAVQGVQAGHRETIPSDCPPGLAHIIRACWMQEPGERPSAHQVAQVLEGLWQQAIAAELPPPSLVRQPSTIASRTTDRGSSVVPGIGLESKRKQPAIEDSLSLVTEGTPIPLSVQTAPVSTDKKDELPSRQALDIAFKDLPPNLLGSLMPDLIKQGAFTPVEKKVEPPTTPTTEPFTPSDSLPSTAAFKTLLAQSPTPRWQDKRSPQYTLGVKLQLLRQKVLIDPYIIRELSCYIAPNGQAVTGKDLPSNPLYPWVEQELLQGDAQVLLLQGLAGAGKSTFNRYLLTTLWQDPAWQSYRPGDPAPKAPLPIFIPLQSAQVLPENLWDYYRHLPEIGGFTLAEIQLLQRDYHTLWIADGYDEIPGQRAPNLFDTNQLGHPEVNVKLVISCRSQRVQTLNEADSFMPHTTTGTPDGSRYRTRHVSPFTSQQTQDYIDKFVAQHQNDPDRPKDWDVVRYQQEFAALPELQTLIDTPFMLWMTLSILPELTKERPLEKIPPATKEKTDEKEAKNSLSLVMESKAKPSHKSKQSTPTPGKAHITRTALYDQFMDTWFTRQARKAWQQRSYLQDPAAILGKAHKQALKKQADQAGVDDVQVVWLKAAYRAFCLSFAQQLAQAGQVSAQSDRLEEIKETTASWQRQLLGDASGDSGKLRQGCPLRESSDHAWSFIHASLLDYFITTAVAEQLVLPPDLSSSQNLPRTRYGEAGVQHSIDVPRLVRGIQKTETLKSPLLTTQHTVFIETYTQGVTLLTQRHVTSDQAQFLADRVRTEPAFKAALWTLIERSKRDPAIAIVSANAITILNAARLVFSNLDLAGIRVPGANLAGSYWDRVDLQGADLSNTDLRFTWMSQCRLQQARLSRVNFGEFPSVLAKNRVKAIAMDPRNPHLMAVAAGRHILIYDRVACQVVRQLEGHTKNVTCLSYAPDGRQLASGSGDYGSASGEVWLWDPQGEKPSQTLQGHTRGVNCLSYAPDGGQLASGSDDRTVRLWDPQGEKPSQALQGHTGEVTCLSYAPDGGQLASGSNDETVRLWDLRGEKPSQELQGHRASVTCLSYAPDGGQLASGGGDVIYGGGEVWLWDPRGEKPSQELRGHTKIVNCLSYAPDGGQLASGGGDYKSASGEVWLWDLRGEKPGQALQGHTAPVTCLSYTPDGGQLASGSYDKTVRLWDPRGEKPSQALQGQAPVTCLSYTPDGGQLASGSYDKTVRLWDPRGEKPSQALQGHTDSVYCLSYAPDGEQLASGGIYGDKTVRLWDPQGEKPSQALHGHTARVNCLSYAPDGGQLASGGEDRTVRLWDPRGEKPSQEFPGHIGIIRCLSYSPDGGQLASGGEDGMRLWDPWAKNPLQALEKPRKVWLGHQEKVRCLSYAPDGGQLASGSEDTTVRLWDPREEKPSQELRGHTKEVRCLSYAPDGGQLASGSDDKTVRLWDPRGEKPCQELRGHTRRVNCLSYAPDGGQLASGSDDKTVRLWDPRGEKPCQELRGHTKEVNYLSYAPDGGQLASGSDDKTVRIWDTRTGACLLAWSAPAPVRGLLWRAEGLFLGCDNGAVAALQRNPAGLWVLAWLQSGRLPVLDWHGCDLTDAQGLQPFQTALIKQRGGQNLPSVKPLADEKAQDSDRDPSIAPKETIQSDSSTVLPPTTFETTASSNILQVPQLPLVQPGSTSTHGNAKKHQGDTAGAIADYREAIDLQPDTVELKPQLAEAYKKLSLNKTVTDKPGLLTMLGGLFKRRPHYTNAELLAQATRLVADIRYQETKPYQKKLDHYRYRKQIHTLSKSDREQLEALVNSLQHLHLQENRIPTTASPARLTLATPTSQSSLSGGHGRLFTTPPEQKTSASTSTAMTIGALLQAAHQALDTACPPSVTARAELRRDFVKQLAEYKSSDPSKLPTVTQQRALQDMIQTLQDIQGQTNTRVSQQQVTSSDPRLNTPR